jgi:hypothetical protein
MTCRAIPAGLLAAAGLLAPAARADDVMRLDLKKPAATPAVNLNFDGKDADTLDVGGRGGGFHGGGGFRGVSFHGGSFHSAGFHGGSFRAVGFHSVGFRGGFNVGFRTFPVGWNRGWGWGWNRGWGWGWGWNRPWWGWNRGWGWGWGSPGFSVIVSRPIYSFPSSVILAGDSSYCPIDMSSTWMPPAASLDYGPGTTNGDPSVAPLPAPRPVAPAPGTYPYDGGPRMPVPMPKTDPTPTTAPPASVPLEGRSASLQAKPAKLSYLAYGEKPARSTTVAKDRAVAKSEPIKQVSR